MVKRMPRRRTVLLPLLMAAAFALSLLVAVPGSAAEQARINRLPVTVVPTFAAEGPRIDPQIERDLERLDPNDVYGLFVHLRGGEPRSQRDLVESHGLSVTSMYPTIDVVFAVGAAAEVRSLVTESAVEYLEANRKLTYYGDTGPWSTRARVAQQAVGGGPYRDGTGAIVDGAGVGVAVVDTGIDGTHPDLARRVVANYKIICSTPGLINSSTRRCFGPSTTQQAPITDTTGGHGTHVAGIVAGDGTASAQTYAGAAPGAALYGFGVGEGLFMFSVVEAFEFIRDNYDSLTPRIRVINNSYGDDPGTVYDPDGVFSKLTAELVGKGVTVVFAAGNSSGNGSADMTSSFSKDPTPGVISVANYNDANSGDRNNVLHSTSSRGRKEFPSTYPDISAPGASIVSTCNQALTTCTRGPTLGWQPHYSTLTGTSMAAPHVAGVAAMLYQAKPDLTPAAVEDILQDTAHKFGPGASYESDPQNPGGTTSFDKGAGLVNVPAALTGAGAPRDGADTSGVAQVVATDDDDGLLMGAADLLELSVGEEAAGLRYLIRVRDVEDLGGATTIQLRVTQNIDGRGYLTTVVLTADGVDIPGPGSANTAEASEAERDVETDTVHFLVPFSEFGNPPANAPAHNVFASSFVGAIVDVAPGGPGADVVVRPRHGAPYTIHPQDAPDPTMTPTASPSPTATPSPTASATATPISSPTPTPSPTSSTSPAVGGATDLRFTDASARSGQYSDDAEVAARLSDGDGNPIEGAELTFELVGRDASRSFTGMTDASGVAASTLLLEEQPGPYELRVRYAGTTLYEGSADATGFVLAREDTDTTLRVTGSGRSKTLMAHLVDQDSGSGLSGRSIDFFVDAGFVGSAVTGDDGVAIFEVAGKEAKGSHRYKAEFPGDLYYRYSVHRVDG